MSLPTQAEQWARCPPGMEEQFVEGGDPNAPACTLALDTYPAEEIPIDPDNNLAPDLLASMNEAIVVTQDLTTQRNQTVCVDCGGISEEAKVPDSTEPQDSVTKAWRRKAYNGWRRAKAVQGRRMGAFGCSQMKSPVRAQRFSGPAANPMGRRNTSKLNPPFMTFDAHLMVPDRLKDWQEGQRPPVFNRDEQYDIGLVQSRRIGTTPIPLRGARKWH